MPIRGRSFNFTGETRLRRSQYSQKQMNIMERIHAFQTAWKSAIFLHGVSNMETPLTPIGKLATALCLASEEEFHGTVVQELARNIG